MPVFMCRWENGDLSFVSAEDREGAIILLDQIGNAEGQQLTIVEDFSVHFHLNDRGEIEFEDFGEQTWGDVDNVYPILSELGDLPDPEEAKEAVIKERDRIKCGPVPIPFDPLDRKIKRAMDVPNALLNDVKSQIAGKQKGRTKK